MGFRLRSVGVDVFVGVDIITWARYFVTLDRLVGEYRDQGDHYAAQPDSGRETYLDS
ncbi:hypothetical protein [Mycobacterium lepromatosis]|uniref:hypothetical protein n=1 Tax=Mycobacterium lepromatosis TaxID=480418 RepID=UPI000B27D774|nr:hypothetical protein [Mycobacterium lepromatosis]